MASPSSKTKEEDPVEEGTVATLKNHNKTCGSYQDKISSLPKVKGCFNTELISYQGGYYMSFYMTGLMRMQDQFIAHSSDILLASFPKSGTTWMKALLFAIVNRTHYNKEDNPLLTKISHEIIPSLELQLHRDGPCMRIFQCHDF